MSTSFPDLNDFYFYGHNGIECEDFINVVRRLARTYGKEEDPAWVARCVSVCFAEEALRWHIKLSEEIKGDWKLLEAALIDQFPAPDNRESKYSTAIARRKITPAPAYAAPLIPRKRNGAIKVTDGDGTFRGWIQKQLHTNGYALSKLSIENAMLISCNNTTERQRMEILNSDVTKWKHLGVGWTSDPSGDKTLWGKIQGISGSQGSNGDYKIRNADIWNIGLDNTIGARSSNTELYFRIDGDDEEVFLTNGTSHFIMDKKKSAVLTFVPMEP